MLELYHSWDPFCSFKVRLCLEGKGLDWTGQHIDLMKFENLRPDYLAVNRNGLVPTLIDEGTVIVESTIINEYLDEPGRRDVFDGSLLLASIWCYEYRLHIEKPWLELQS